MNTIVFDTSNTKNNNFAESMIRLWLTYGIIDPDQVGQVVYEYMQESESFTNNLECRYA